MFVNGQSVQQINHATCTSGIVEVDLSTYLRKGSNQIMVVVHPLDKMFELSIHLSKLNPLTIIPILSIIATLVLTGFLFITKQRTTPLISVCIGIFILGIVLRILYMYGTTYEIRAPDVRGHIEYIKTMSESLRLPESSEGWGHHHSPLYHAIASIWVRIGNALSMQFGNVLRAIQIQSLISSVITLIIGMKIGEMLLGHKKCFRSLTMFWIIFATLPGLIFFASRINNDTLVQVWFFLGLLCILYWWQKGHMRYWYAALAITLLGFLSKITCLILLPAMGCCLLVRRDKSWKEKWVTLGITGLIAILGTGWFFHQRLVVEEAHYVLIGNRMPESRRVDTSLKGILMLHPIRIVQIPFTRLGHHEDKQYFWEYYIRSTFFGRYSYKGLHNLGSTIMLLVVVLIPIIFYGLLRDVRKDWYANFPMLMILFWLFAAQIIRRFISPFDPSQDFRLTTLVIVPILFYAVSGIRNLPRFPQKTAETVVYSLAVCSTWYILQLSLF